MEPMSFNYYLTQHKHRRQRISNSSLQPLQHDVDPERGGVALGDAQDGARRAREHRRCFTTVPGKDGLK